MDRATQYGRVWREACALMWGHDAILPLVELFEANQLSTANVVALDALLDNDLRSVRDEAPKDVIEAQHYDAFYLLGFHAPSGIWAVILANGLEYDPRAIAFDAAFKPLHQKCRDYDLHPPSAGKGF